MGEHFKGKISASAAPSVFNENTQVVILHTSTQRDMNSNMDTNSICNTKTHWPWEIGL